MVTRDDVIEALRPVKDPELNRSFVELNMIREVEIQENAVDVEVALTVKGCPLKGKIRQDVAEAVEALSGVDYVNVRLGVMDDDDRQELVNQRAGDDANSRILEPDSPTEILAVASGKGGVGKSTTTVNLAAALQRSGATVGVMDADVYGFSIPRMLDIEGEKPISFNGAIAPLHAYDMQVISMGSFVEEGTPVIWRGPMLMRAIEQFINDVLWGDPDYLFIDLPPGTGDVPLTLMQKLPQSKMVLVTTPQPTATKVAHLAGAMARKTEQEIVGVVENMSYYVCPDCGRREHLFGQGGGEALSDDLDVPLLGQIPLVPEVRTSSDEGTPIVLRDGDSQVTGAYMDIAARLLERSEQETVAHA